MSQSASAADAGEARSERVHNLLPQRRPTLEAMFAPQSVAVIGASATPGSIGRTLLENLRPFSGNVFAVNPKRSSILGRETYPKIGDVPGTVDLAIIATPAWAVPPIVAECAEAGVKGAVIISAGFKECGAGGAELEEQIRVRRGAMRIVVGSPGTELEFAL